MIRASEIGLIVCASFRRLVPYQGTRDRAWKRHDVMGVPGAGGPLGGNDGAARKRHGTMSSVISLWLRGGAGAGFRSTRCVGGAQAPYSRLCAADKAAMLVAAFRFSGDCHLSRLLLYSSMNFLSRVLLFSPSLSRPSLA